MSIASRSRHLRALWVLALVASVLVVYPAAPAAAAGPSVFINEIHYDNAGTDTGEAIEVAGPAGADLTGWSIVLYNGNGGAAYNTTTLSGAITDQQSGFGTVVVNYPSNGIQNGSPDGIALVDDAGAVVQFLSYEGTFVAVGGAADGMTSTDIGVSEPGDTPIGDSLQLFGTGTGADDFTWATPQPNTFGAPNTGQTFSGGPVLFINEIHYDNTGGDTGEAVEVAGPAGTDLAGWSIVLYNGNGGAPYDTIALSGTLPDQQAGFGTLDFARAGIQNGSPDGLALVDPASSVIQFLSYEGTFVAVGGPADGLTSVDIGVSEPGDTPIGDSLQLFGTGTGADDFTWATPQPNTFGAPNTGQTFGGGGGPTDPVINEFVANHTGSDTEAFVEVYGFASTDYSAMAVLEIEGDGSGAGVIDAVLPVTSTDAGGFWVDDEDMENGTLTILLVEGFSGTAGDDLDTNDDGTLDSTPWDRIVDDVAVSDGDSSDRVYSSTVLAPFFDGNSFTVGGASRIPNGTDTDSTADWVRNDFDLAGIPGFFGTPVAGEALNTPNAVNELILISEDPPGVCNDPATLIHDIQGNGPTSNDLGSIREIEGVVVGDFQADDGDFSDLAGFYVQEEDADADADEATSEGLFVYDLGSPVDVSLGDLVRIRGAVGEFQDQTQISIAFGSGNVVVCSSDQSNLVTPAELPFPLVNGQDTLEQFEGMLVTTPDDMVVIEYFNLDRYGVVDVATERLEQPTDAAEPGPASDAVAAYNAARRIRLDDGNQDQNAYPVFLPDGQLEYADAFGGGDLLNDIEGPLSWIRPRVGGSPEGYAIQLNALPTSENANPRPTTPPSVGGTLEVAGFNVLNYFNGDGMGGGFPTSRGASDPAELVKQTDKIVSAITGFDADVVGLVEIENDFADGEYSAVADLVEALNATTGAGSYAWVDPGANVGADEIAVALIYKPASVMPLGDLAVLDDPSFIDPLNSGTDRNRAAIAQTFLEVGTGGEFTAVVNHLKSKGSGCGPGDDDPRQGNCNGTRTAAAEVLVDWLDTDPTGSSDPDIVLLGDYNSYAMEDPIKVLEAAGYVDLLEAFQPEDVYTYVFDGQTGYLDYGLASGSLFDQVTGAAAWNINSDEPDAFEYDEAFDNPNNLTLWYDPSAFASSDHDPVIVGLDMSARPAKERLAEDLAQLLPTGSPEDDMYVGQAILRIEQSLNEDWWIDDSTLDPKDGGRVFDREHQAVTQLEEVTTADVQWAIDQILMADRQLALKELLAAIDAGGNPTRIAMAHYNLAMAEANIAAGFYEEAVLDYKRAWMNAIKAQ